MSRADKDGTGTLDLIEFLGMMRDKIKEENKESEINEAFKVFDTVMVSLVLTCSKSNTNTFYNIGYDFLIVIDLLMNNL